MDITYKQWFMLVKIYNAYQNLPLLKYSFTSEWILCKTVEKSLSPSSSIITFVKDLVKNDVLYMKDNELRINDKLCEEYIEGSSYFSDVRMYFDWK